MDKVIKQSVFTSLDNSVLGSKGQKLKHLKKKQKTLKFNVRKGKANNHIVSRKMLSLSVILFSSMRIRKNTL